MTEGIENCSSPTQSSGSIKERIIQTFTREKKNSKTEGGGQVHLWQFLLELLSKADHKSIIQWDGEDGVFVFKKPDEVARMWGDTKKKRDMNYEKLSRSLRYYYEKHIMSKVSGKHYSYKFHLDGLTRAYHPTGVSDSLYIQTYDMNCPSRNFPFPSPLLAESGSDPDERL